MKTRYLKILLAAIFFGCTFGCSTISTQHSLSYSLTDNPNISLLAWEYSDRRRPSFKSKQPGFGNFSHGFNQIGEDIKITWLNKAEQKTYSQTIPIKNSLPINMHGAEILISFSESNQPEIYIVYKNPDQFNTFQFKGKVYSDRLVRMIYPTKKNISIKNTRIY